MSTSLPPGPRLPALVQTLVFFRYRHAMLPLLRRRYGDVLRLRVVPDQQLVMVCRPEHVREVFTGAPETMHAGEGNAVLGPVMGQHSVLLVDDAQHVRARRLLMPAFNGVALRGYAGLIEQLAEQEVSGWSPGEPFRALDRMNRLTLKIICRVVFGIRQADQLERLRPLVNATVAISPLVLLGWAYPRLQRVGPWRRYVDVQTALDAELYAQIGARRDHPDAGEGSDVLSRLLAVGDDESEPLTDVELRDQLVTLLLAGHETTASALAWALHELAYSPETQARAREAADSGQPGDAYLQAVLKESMRLHPVISFVARRLTAPTQIAGYRLPAGVTVMPSILLAHADPDAYPHPERFDPDRFVGESPPPNTWIPFGGGTRRCLGAGFALLEGTAVLRAVLRRWELQPVRPARNGPASATSPRCRAAGRRSRSTRGAGTTDLRRRCPPRRWSVP